MVGWRLLRKEPRRRRGRGVFSQRKGGGIHPEVVNDAEDYAEKETRVGLALAPCSWTLDTVASVAVVARDSFCGSRPKVVAPRIKGTTKNSQSRRLSTNHTKRFC